MSKKDIGSAVMLPSEGGARILPFPLSRRCNLVKKLAEQMLARSPKEAERHLAFELERHRRILGRRQLSEGAIEVAIRALAAAVRTELWLLIMTPRGGQQRGIH